MSPKITQGKVGLYRGRGALVFKGGYHTRVQKQNKKRVVFQGKTHTVQAVFRVSKTAKNQEKGYGF